MPRPLHCHESIELIDPPLVTPISLDEAKVHARVDFTDDDTYITGLIAAAVAYVDAQGVLGKAMISQGWRQYAGPNPGAVRLLIGPVQTVNRIKYYDPDGVEQTANLADYNVYGNGQSTTVEPKSGSWPQTEDRPDAIWVEYVSGFGDLATDVPETVRHALKFLVSHWYENREPTSKAMASIPMGFNALIGVERECWYG